MPKSDQRVILSSRSQLQSGEVISSLTFKRKIASSSDKVGILAMTLRLLLAAQNDSFNQMLSEGRLWRNNFSMTKAAILQLILPTNQLIFILYI